MAFSKAKLYDKEEQMLAFYFKGFNHPARIRIIRHLSLTGSTHVENLAVGHPISVPSFSDHLKKLRTIQLVDYEEKFPFINYSIEEENLRHAKRQIELFFESIKC